MNDGTGATGAYFGIDSDEEEGATGGAPVSAQGSNAAQRRARPMSAPSGHARTTEEWARETLQRLRLEQLERMATATAAEKSSQDMDRLEARAKEKGMEAAGNPPASRTRPRPKSRIRRSRC